MWRSEAEMLELVRRRATARRRRHRVLSATAGAGLLVAVAVSAVAVAGGGGSPEVRVAGGVEGAAAVRGRPAPSTPESAGTGARVEATAPGATTTTVAASGGGASVPGAPAVDPGDPPPAAGADPQPPPASADATGPDTPVSGPSSTAVGAGPPPLEPTRVTLTLGAVDLVPRPFESTVPLSDTSIAVRFWSGIAPCDVIGRVDVQETGDRVTITLYGGREPSPEPAACIAIASYQEIVVNLSAPLAGREIVDGAA